MRMPIHVLRENAGSDQDSQMPMSLYLHSGRARVDPPIPAARGQGPVCQGFEIGGNMRDDRIRGAWCFPCIRCHKPLACRYRGQ